METISYLNYCRKQLSAVMYNMSLREVNYGNIKNAIRKLKLNSELTNEEENHFDISLKITDEFYLLMKFNDPKRVFIKVKPL